MPTSLANLIITDTFATWVNKINDIVAAINTIQTEGAPQLATARTIALSGAATGSASFDGSKNITITTTLANSGVTAGSYGLSANVTPADGATFNVPFIAVNAKGLVTSAKTCTVKLPTNVGTADKLTTARTINGVKFDGSANIHHYGTCSTAAGTQVKTVTLNNFVLATGATVWVKFTATNTHASPSLNVNGTGAKSIRYLNAALPNGMLQANGIYQLLYDGTCWQLVNGGASLATIDPWDIFPMYVPIGVFGVKFGGSDGRRAIMPGETKTRENWVICDGGSDGKGGTVPDLRGRFIMGASDEYKAGSTGGSKTHSHIVSGTVGETTLTESQLAEHFHNIYTGNGRVQGGNSDNVWQGVSHGWRPQTEPAGESQTHTHPLEGTTNNANSLPLFYALSYIMRCA